TGLVISSYLYSLLTPLPASEISASYSTLMIAGLLVGFGTRMGSGCTSGHGICGLSRLSLRSLIATMSFMLSGFIVTYVLVHVI
ncbi:MAG TPA: YeeE/YedE family protein, partial [Methylotenera mobilis]|nr:YeeE/YedE family protein [Methylotenera mobilis]